MTERRARLRDCPGMRFLCDEMLVRLARLLRAAGYDADLAACGQADAELLRRAREEARLLLTRDKRLARVAAPASVLIEGRGVAEEARSLSRVIPVDWSLAPFSRCVMDNAPLTEADAAQFARIPPQAQALGGPFRACPTCGRVYWPGSHVKRMAERLENLAQLAPQARL